MANVKTLSERGNTPDILDLMIPIFWFFKKKGSGETGMN